jgi:hypothetical protein
MARKTDEAELFGVRYRITQMSAAEAFPFIVSKNEPRPLEMLRGVCVKAESGWFDLNVDTYVDTYVRDTRNIFQPRLVLNGLLMFVAGFNWGFLERRSSPKVPTYLRSDSAARQVDGEDPVLTALVAADKATLHELETYYSLEDAFRIYDILFVDQLNKAQASYDAAQEAKRKR